MSEIPLQFEMFTGGLVDNRTPQQKRLDDERYYNLKQMEMFSQRDIAQFGVSARPMMSLSPGRLQLVNEDPRSEEEIEHDLMQEAERLTAPMFTQHPGVYVYPMEAQPPASSPSADTFTPPTLEVLETVPESDISASDDMDIEDEPEITPAPPVTKYAAYVALVNAAEERAATLFQSPTSAISESITMSSAKLNAQLAGLTGDEIATALTIGEFRGRTTAITNPPASPPKDWDVPVLWTSRADMVKRRPDLAPHIQALRDDEVEALAALLTDALEEFYWIQLNVVLSLVLDHELQVRRRIQ